MWPRPSNTVSSIGSNHLNGVKNPMIAYLKENRLYTWEDGVEREHVSEFIEQKRAGIEKQNRHVAWKGGMDAQDTMGQGGAFWGNQVHHDGGLNYTFVDAKLLQGVLYYLIEFSEFVGLFKYDPETGYEERFFHKNGVKIFEFDFSPTRDQFIFSMGHADGTVGLYLANGAGKIIKQLTDGDAQDRFPSFAPNGSILYASAGIARNDSYGIGERSPFRIQQLNLDDESIEIVHEIQDADLLAPKTIPNSTGDGDSQILCIHKPYRSIHHIPPIERVKHALMMPYYLGYMAVGFIQYLIRTFGNPKFTVIDFGAHKKPLNSLRLYGEMVKLSKKGDDEKLMPDAWRLYNLSTQQFLASNIAAFDVEGDSYIFTTGRVCKDANGQVVCRLKDRSMITQLMC